jgi:hypothetical protein
VHQRGAQLGVARALDRRREAALGDVEPTAVRVEHRANPDQRSVLAPPLFGDRLYRGAERLAFAALEQTDAVTFDHPHDAVDGPDLGMHRERDRLTSRPALEQLRSRDMRVEPFARPGAAQLAFEELAKQVVIPVFAGGRDVEERDAAPQLDDEVGVPAERFGDLLIEGWKDAAAQQEALLRQFESGEDLLGEIAVHHLARAAGCRAQIGRVGARAQGDRKRDRPAAGELAQGFDLGRLGGGLRVVGGRERFVGGEAQIVFADR